MACLTCRKVKVQAPMQSGLPFTVLGGALRVTGKDGRRYPIQTNLIPPMREPLGGWKVSFKINGQSHTVDGNPIDIFRQVKRLFDLNSIKHTALDLWFNLNLQWTSRALERYQKVRHRDLLALAIPNQAYHDQVPE
jgi:hypothetical protein